MRHRTDREIRRAAAEAAEREAAEREAAERVDRRQTIRETIESRGDIVEVLIDIIDGETAGYRGWSK